MTSAPMAPMSDAPDPTRSGGSDPDLDGPLGAFISMAIEDDYRARPPQSPGGGTLPLPTGAGRSPHRAMVGAAAIAVVIGLIGAVAILAVRSTDDERARTRADLVERVRVQSDLVDERRAAVEEATARVDDLRVRLQSATTVDPQAARIDRLARMAGTTPLSGPGISVTIHDAPDAAAGSLNRVLDRDLQLVVNALWKMGASGIAINGQRLTSQSAIRGAGQAILVDYQPVLAPYRIDAIGTSSADPTDNDLVALLAGLRETYGLDSTVSAGDVALPAGESRPPHFANVDEEDRAP